MRLFGSQVERGANGVPGSRIGIFLEPLRRAIEEDQKCRLVPKSQCSGARGGSHHQQVDTDLTFGDQFRQRLAHPIPASHRYGRDIQDDFYFPTYAAKVCKAKRNTRNRAGEKGIA